MPVHTYSNGKPYIPAKGRIAPKPSIENHVSKSHSVVVGRPSSTQFVNAILREMKIRCYRPSTIKQYHSNLNKFLSWFGKRPNLVNSETVRQFLEFLVDGGAEPTTLCGYLSAIRTAFDKFCQRDITLGLTTPRKPKKIPVVPSRQDITRLLQAALTIRDKMLIGLMYATGMRVSEVARLRWSDLDFERKTIRVEMGKGAVDRLAALPNSFHSVLFQQSLLEHQESFIFKSSVPGRHISTRTIERAISSIRGLAGIQKTITPHSLRHAFATHSLENGIDIRFIQKLLGHAKLETTTIYTKLASPRSNNFISPLDQLGSQTSPIKKPTQYSGETDHRAMVSVNVRLVSEKHAVASATIRHRNQRYSIDQIRIVENDNRWVAIEMDAIEHWLERQVELSSYLRLKIVAPEFFETLRSCLVNKYLSLSRNGISNVQPRTNLNTTIVLDRKTSAA